MRKEIISDSLSAKLSRRGFMKGVAALSATAALVGCSKKTTGNAASVNPLDTMEVFYGATPHNCGGENCILKAYASGGKVRRVVTDDTRPDKSMDEGDNPQDRACPRCRGRKSTMYYSNRLKYPMIQRGERGDVTTFERVTWQQATEYLKTKAEKIQSKWGIGTLYGLYGSGAGGALSVDGKFHHGVASAWFTGNGYDSGVTFGFEGGSGIIPSFGPIQDYSWPAWEHVSPIIMGDPAYWQANYNASNAYSDVLNAEAIVIWGHNMSETQWTPQITYYLTQIKEKFQGDIYLIDGRFSQTAALLSSHPKFHYVGAINGTDPALIMGMMYEILSNQTNRNALAKKYGLADANDAATFRKAVGKYVFGVFDTDDSDGDEVNKSISGNDTVKNALNSGTTLKVNAGASWSAYIFGSNNYLTSTYNINKGASIYPNKILYNTRDYKLSEWDWKKQEWTSTQYNDVLYGKATMCYGQVEKTPAWASKITGIPEATIKELAAVFASKRVTVWSGSGFQRCTESEEMVRSWICFNAFVRNYGAEGSSFGSVGCKGIKNDIFASPVPKWEKTKVEDNHACYRTDEMGTLVVDTTKGGYNAADPNNKIAGNATLGARYDARLLTATTVNTGLQTDYDMGGNFHNTPNLTSCFTWLENVEASLENAIDTVQKRRHYNVGTNKITEEKVKIRPARYNTGSNQTVSTPTKWLAQVWGNVLANNGGNVNYHVGCYKKKDPNLVDSLNPQGYTIEFISIYDNVFTPSCRYADLVLPDTMGFERYHISGNSWGRGRNFVFTGKAAQPLGDAKPGIDAGYEIAKAWGAEAQYRGSWEEDAKGSIEESAWKDAVSSNAKDQDGNIIPWEEAKKGFFVKDKNPDTEGYIGDVGSTAKEYTNGVSATWKQFRDNPVSAPLATYTGRVEAYSLHYVEDYEARQYNNTIDVDNATSDINQVTDGKVYIKDITNTEDYKLQNSGNIYTKVTDNSASGGLTDAKNRARYVYPVPMYIPLIEGRHSALADTDDTKHPCDMSAPMYDIHADAEVNKVNGCDLTLSTWHIMYRSHSTHNSSGLLNEVKYYKRNEKGEATYYGNDAESVDERTGTNTLGAGTYETCWINPATALAKGLAEGDLAVVENSRGQAVFSVHISQRVSPGAVFVGHGSWYNLQASWTSPTGKTYANIDVGGCANTLTNTRPSRMCGGMTLANDCRVKISKA